MCQRAAATGFDVGALADAFVNAVPDPLLALGGVFARGLVDAFVDMLVPTFADAFALVAALREPPLASIGDPLVGASDIIVTSRGRPSRSIARGSTPRAIARAMLSSPTIGAVDGDADVQAVAATSTNHLDICRDPSTRPGRRVQLRKVRDGCPTASSDSGGPRPDGGRPMSSDVSPPRICRLLAQLGHPVIALDIDGDSRSKRSRCLGERGFIRVPTVFSVAEQHGMSTAMFVGKDELRHIAKPGSSRDAAGPHALVRLGGGCRRAAAPG